MYVFLNRKRLPATVHYPSKEVQSTCKRKNQKNEKRKINKGFDNEIYIISKELKAER